MVAIREDADLELAKFIVELGGDPTVATTAGTNRRDSKLNL